MAQHNTSENGYILTIEDKYYNTLDIEGFSLMMKNPQGIQETTFDAVIDELRHFASPVIEIIYILYGQDRNCIGKVIAEKNSIIFCRKICSRCMIRQDDRDMRFGIISIKNERGKIK